MGERVEGGKKGERGRARERQSWGGGGGEGKRRRERDSHVGGVWGGGGGKNKHVNIFSTFFNIISIAGHVSCNLCTEL